MFSTASAATEKVFVPLELASFFHRLRCQEQIREPRLDPSSELLQEHGAAAAAV